MSIETSVESVPVPEPDLTPAELLARARALVPLLREEQEETERRGFYSQELHERFLDAGFYRTLQPRRFGGYEFDLPTFWRLVMTLSSGCPSAGWCFCLAAGHALQLGSLFPERTQAECFGPDGEFLAPARASPYGTAVRDGDGWTIEGTWDYCSGVPYSTHFMPVALAPELGPEATVFAVIPRSQWTMQDDWGGDVILGFRGSGSHSVVVERTWVPGHYVILDNLLDVDVSEGTVGSRLHGNPMYAGRTLGFFHGELVAIVVGTARAALDEYERIVTSRQTFVPPYMPRFHHPDFQRSFGLALGMVDAAESIVLHTADLFMEHCHRNAAGEEPFTAETDFRLFTRLEHAGRLVWEAVELLWRTAGSSAAKKEARMQRYYRDLSIYRGHFSAQFETMATRLGQIHFGLLPVPGSGGAEPEEAPLDTARA